MERDLAVIETNAWENGIPERKHDHAQATVARIERESARGRFQTPAEIKRIIREFEREAQRELDVAVREMQELEELASKCNCVKRWRMAKLHENNLRNSLDHRRSRLQKYLAESESGIAKTSIPLLDRMKKFIGAGND